MAAGSTRACTLELRSELTVRTVHEHYLKLLEDYGQASNLAIDTRQINEADLSLVQLLQSARRTAQRDGKTITLIQPLPEALSSLLVRGGFLSSPSDIAFWTNEVTAP